MTYYGLGYLPAGGGSTQHVTTAPSHRRRPRRTRVTFSRATTATIERQADAQLEDEEAEARAKGVRRCATRHGGGRRRRGSNMHRL
jgi:hypothetical protein